MLVRIIKESEDKKETYAMNLNNAGFVELTHNEMLSVDGGEWWKVAVVALSAVAGAGTGALAGGVAGASIGGAIGALAGGVGAVPGAGAGAIATYTVIK